jgi:hypothetical protein
MVSRGETKEGLMKLAHCTILAALAGLSGAGHADVITDWNERAMAAGQAARDGTPVYAKNIAMTHIAMFEAVNSIEGRYRPYRARLPAAPGTSPEAAAAAAAHGVLARLYPAQAAELDKALAASLAAVRDGAPKTQGVRLGEQAALAILAERVKDGSGGPNTYRPYTAAGHYVPTSFPVFPQWGSVRPFGLKTGDQVRPQAPYALGSAQWAKDFNEVKGMGAKSGSARSAEQSEIGRFWELTGPATFVPLVRQLSAAKGLGIVENARLFALTSMAGADAYIAIFDAKYAHNFWRPVTAIRNADLDGNDATERDPAWEPFVPTPMHPEYPCAHCIVQSSVATVLERFFGGDAIPEAKLTSTTAPGVTRSFRKLSDYVAEVINARIYGGMHYRASGEIGAAMGRNVGSYIVQNQLGQLD